MVPLCFLSSNNGVPVNFPIIQFRGTWQKDGELTIHYIWLVVSTPLKNISQLGLLFPIYGKIKNVPNHQPDIVDYHPVFVNDTTKI